jgi:hypothetical protein
MAFDFLFLNGKIGVQTPVGYSGGQRVRDVENGKVRATRDLFGAD